MEKKTAYKVHSALNVSLTDTPRDNMTRTFILVSQFNNLLNYCRNFKIFNSFSSFIKPIICLLYHKTRQITQIILVINAYTAQSSPRAGTDGHLRLGQESVNVVC